MTDIPHNYDSGCKVKVLDFFLIAHFNNNIFCTCNNILYHNILYVYYAKTMYELFHYYNLNKNCYMYFIN